MAIEPPQEFKKQEEEIFGEWDFEILDEELNGYRIEMQTEQGKKFKGITLKDYFRYLNDKGLTRIVFLKDDVKSMSDVDFRIKDPEEYFKFEAKQKKYYQWKAEKQIGNFGII